MADYETFQVSSLSVACDGGGGALGHPRVFLHIEQEDGAIVCPYCSRQYVLKGVSPHGDAEHRQYGA